MKTVLKNGNVFYQNKIQKLDVEIDGETISQIGHDLDGENIIDCTDLLVTPGFVDLHVHLREPGFEHKGTIKTETLSAKYGGYTHIVAMANTNPCMDDIGILISTDPIAIDQACIDLVYASNDKGRDHLIERIESRNGVHTIEAAAKLGYGSREYELIEID